LFQELVPLLAGGRALMMTVTQPDPQRLTVVVQPMALKDAESPALSVPLVVTATPEQLDAELPGALQEFSAEHRSIAGSLADASRRMKDAAASRDGAKPGGPARPAPQGRVAPPAPPPPPAVPSLWDTPAEEPAGVAPSAGPAAAPPAPAEHEEEPEHVEDAMQEVA